ncbi:MAG: type IV pilus biogenesis/stability protein PilW [Pseudomonadales bacterium]|nr:type IV pilus biogenesis/stability protein PilW [Pseudomonadales bacterium]
MARKTLGILILLLMSACVTTVTGPQKNINPAKQLEVLISLGAGYIQNRQYGRAKENLMKALELDPRSPGALNAFGLVYQLEGEMDLSEEYFKKAIQVSPNFAMVRNNYGAFLYQQGRYEEAIEHLNVAAEDRLYPRRAQVFLNLGISHLKLGQKDEAERTLLRSVQLNNRQPRALLELAEIKFQQKDYADARRYFAQLEASRQTTSRSLWLCVRISKVFNNEDKAASCGLLLKNTFPNTYEYRRYQMSQNP